MISAPSTEPARLKRPPSSDVPPSVTARIASSSSSSPALLPSALRTFELARMPASADITPEHRYTPNTTAPERSPTSRVATGFTPIARMNSPSAVRFTSSAVAPIVASAIHTAHGTVAR
ncbi:hypothetical protein IST4112_06858 [Burkholderia cenocepacia]|nr:hypothetical protein IST4112_06858 [Burkholderia cenocepacia]